MLFRSFTATAEKLKDTTRHCYTSGGRHESVAEHTYRLCVFAWLVRKEFPECDMERVMQMCLFHDLGEAMTGDIPCFEKEDIHRRTEAEALEHLTEFLQEPDVLLLDEPTNHLDAESIDWLEQHLQQYEGTVIAVTHDRYFLDDVSEWILELDRGEGIPWKGNYSSWLDQKTKRMIQEEKTASKRRKTLERELEWVRMAPKARQAKGKARLNSYEQMLNQEQKEREEKLEIFIPNGPRLGNKVIEAQHVKKAFGEKVLFNDLNFMLPPNGIVGVIGPNGAGKTTLFRLIMGLDQADGGTFEVGETVKLAYVDQQHKDIDPQKTVYEVISQGNETLRLGGRDVNARAYISRFNFSGTDQSKLCSVLSGGERNRLQLALALKQEGNVLLLDEPTNDIDVNTLRALEEGLKACCYTSEPCHILHAALMMFLPVLKRFQMDFLECRLCAVAVCLPL